MVERFNFCWESISETFVAQQGSINISSAVVNGVLTIRKK